MAVYVKTKDGKAQVGVAVRDGDGLLLTLGMLEAGGSVPVPQARPVTKPGPLPTTFPNYGRSKGGPIAGATADDLSYYAAGARKSLADPAKAQWHAKEQALLAAIEAEQARPSAPPPAYAAPSPARNGPSDDDIPF